MTLKHALQRRGFGITFVCAELPKQLDQSMREQGVSVLHLNHRQDNAETLNILARDSKAVAVILDGYHFDSEYQQEIFSAQRPLILFDDLNNRGIIYAHMIINSMPHADQLGYEISAPQSILLAGLQYTLLRGEFISVMQQKVAPVTDRPRLLVNFGGSDILSLSVPVCRTLLQQEPLLPVTLITGSGYSNPRKVEPLSAQYENFEHIHDCKDMAAQFMRAGLALSAPGATVYELAACHVPAILMICADNQALSAKAHEQLGWCLAFDGRQPKQYEKALLMTHKLWQNPALRQVLQNSCHGLIPAQGTEHIAQHIEHLIDFYE
jgi:UDP-2,4-diacetamido-2,4,6-trideoxy-beta-L-altropyranose hydrolase